MFYPLPIQTPIRRRLPVLRRRVTRSLVPVANNIGGAGDDVIIISGGTQGPPGPQGIQGIQGPIGPAGPAGSLIVPTTTVEANYTALSTDYFIGVVTSAPYTITLPLAPDGTVYIVKDLLGNASTNPITITNTALIDGTTTAVINTNYGSLTFIFANGAWSLV